MIVPLTIHRKKKRLDRLGLRSLITSRQSDSFGRISPFLCFYIVYQVSSHVFTVTQNTTYRKFYQCNSLFFISLPITLCALTLPLSVTRALKTIGDDSGKRCKFKKNSGNLCYCCLTYGATSRFVGFDFRRSLLYGPHVE